MKTLLSLLCLSLSCGFALGQGTVTFHNTTGTRITNGNTGEVVGVNPDLTVGLYVGASGSTANQLVLVGSTTRVMQGRE